MSGSDPANGARALIYHEKKEAHEPSAIPHIGIEKPVDLGETLGQVIWSGYQASDEGSGSGHE